MGCGSDGALQVVEAGGDVKATVGAVLLCGDSKLDGSGEGAQVGDVLGHTKGFEVLEGGGGDPGAGAREEVGEGFGFGGFPVGGRGLELGNEQEGGEDEDRVGGGGEHHPATCIAPLGGARQVLVEGFGP